MSGKSSVNVKRIQATLEPDLYAYFLTYKTSLQGKSGVRLTDSQILNAMLKEIKCKNLLAA